MYLVSAHSEIREYNNPNPAVVELSGVRTLSVLHRIYVSTYLVICQID